MPSLDDIQDAQKPVEGISKAKKRPSPKKRPGPGRPRKDEIPRLTPEIVDEEPGVKVDYAQMQFVIDQWLAVAAEIPCKLFGLEPLLLDERKAVVSSGKAALEYWLPETADPTMIFMATCATVYGGKFMQKQMARKQQDDTSPSVGPNNPPPDHREDGFREDGTGQEAH